MHQCQINNYNTYTTLIEKRAHIFRKIYNFRLNLQTEKESPPNISKNKYSQ